MSLPVARSRRRPTAYEAFEFKYPDFVDRIVELRRYRDRELRKLSVLTEHRARRDRLRKLLRCPKLALLYAYEATRRVQQLHKSTPAAIEELASRCDPFKPSYEPVFRLEVPRIERQAVMPIHQRRRFVQNFGPLKRMSQMLVADLLLALHPPRPEQYLFAGGMPAALKAVEAAFREGYTHAVEIDMIDFYGAVRLDGLAGILRPLPSAVLDHVIWDHTSRRGRDDDIDDAVPVMEGDPSRSGLVGLSLGAATSPIVGEAIIRLLLETANMDGVVAYADNLLVLGRGAEDTVARANHLRSVAERLEAGPLRPRVGDVARFERGDDAETFDPDNRHGVEFLKQVCSVAGDGRSSWAPCAERQEEHRVADIIADIMLDEIRTAELQVVQWRRAYPLWEGGDLWEVERLAELAAARYYRSAQLENRTAARHALFIAQMMAGPDRLLEEFAPDGSTNLQRQRRSALLAETRDMIFAMARTHQA